MTLRDDCSLRCICESLKGTTLNCDGCEDFLDALTPSIHERMRGIEYMRKYNAKPEVKKKTRERVRRWQKAHPERRRAWAKEYQRRDSVVAKRRTPEALAKKSAYDKERRRRLKEGGR